MAFQTQVNVQPSPAVEGDFASANPRRSMLAGPGALIAGTGGVIVGRFGWALDADGVVTNAKPVGAARVGFIGRNQPVVITGWLQPNSMTLTEGLEITLHDGGDFWTRFAAPAAIGQKVFVDDDTGLAIAGDAGDTIAGATETDWTIATAAGAGELAKITA